MKTLFVDQLTVIDFSYLHHTRGLLGESWLVDCELSGELNDEGMLFDFGHVKKFIKEFIDTYADHKLIVASQTENLTTTEEPDQRITIEWSSSHRYLKTSAPEDAFLFIEEKEVTPSTLSELLETWIKTLLPDNVSGIRLHLYPETLRDSYYHYSHGLKKHDGNCQRIAHGHRSPIEIYLNNQRSAALEQEWANRFEDIYIGTREDLVHAKTQVSKNNLTLVHFNYTAPQGLFSLSINESNVYLIDTDSTVEWIADHIAQEIHKQHPNDQVKVKAFEGYRKGAIAEC